MPNTHCQAERKTWLSWEQNQHPTCHLGFFPAGSFANQLPSILSLIFWLPPLPYFKEHKLCSTNFHQAFGNSLPNCAKNGWFLAEKRYPGHFSITFPWLCVRQDYKNSSHANLRLLDYSFEGNSGILIHRILQKKNLGGQHFGATG